MGWLAISGALCALAFAPLNWWWMLLFAPALGLHRLYVAGIAQAAWGAFWWGGGYWVALSVSALPVFQQGDSEWAGGVAWMLALLWMLGWWTAFGALLGWLRLQGWQWVVGAACLWTLMSWARALGALGFPWGMFALGLGQTPFLLLPASLGGVWLVEWLIIAWNGALVLAWRGQGRTASVLGGLLALFWLGYGAGYWLWTPPPKGTLRVGVVYLMPSSVYALQIERERYVSLIRTAVQQGAQWVVFPEATESYAHHTDPNARRWQRWSARYGTCLLVGASITHATSHKNCNSALAFAPDLPPARYDKVKLMAFTEWLPPAPFKKLLRPLGIHGDGLLAGERIEPLWIEGQPPVGTLICVESLFGWTARQQVRQGAQWLCLLTAESSLKNATVRQQYTDFTVLRAIETGRWVARSAFDGYEIGFYGPLGERIVQHPQKTVVAVGTIGLYAHQTPYVRLGDWWAYLCVVAVGVLGWRARTQGVSD
jgi:apolipoprotein N-acyltransferase